MSMDVLDQDSLPVGFVTVPGCQEAGLLSGQKQMAEVHATDD